MGSREISIYKLTIRYDFKIAVCLLILFTLLIRLGLWQLDRAEQKREMLRLYTERLTATPTVIETLWPALKQGGNARKKLQSLRVALQGSYINDKSMLLVNQYFGGRLGAEIIVPVQLSSGNGIALVNRGWSEITGGDSNGFAPSVVEGEHVLVAELFVPHGGSFYKPASLDAKQWPIRLHRLDIQALQKLFAQPLFPYLLRLEADNPGSLERHWRREKIDPSKSSLYALQWFAMAVALLVATVLISTNLKALLRR